MSTLSTLSILFYNKSFVAPVVYPAIFVLVCKLEHLINVFFIDRNRKVPHHKLKVCLGKIFIFYLPLFCPKILRIRICPTNDLRNVTDHFSRHGQMEWKPWRVPGWEPPCFLRDTSWGRACRSPGSRWGRWCWPRWSCRSSPAPRGSDPGPSLLPVHPTMTTIRCLCVVWETIK